MLIKRFYAQLLNDDKSGSFSIVLGFKFSLLCILSGNWKVCKTNYNLNLELPKYKIKKQN